MSLFVLASKDGWVNIMYHGLDAVAIDQQVTNKQDHPNRRSFVYKPPAEKKLRLVTSI